MPIKKNRSFALDYHSLERRNLLAGLSQQSAPHGPWLISSELRGQIHHEDELRHDQHAHHEHDDHDHGHDHDHDHDYEHEHDHAMHLEGLVYKVEGDEVVVSFEQNGHVRTITLQRFEGARSETFSVYLQDKTGRLSPFRPLPSQIFVGGADNGDLDLIAKQDSEGLFVEARNRDGQDLWTADTHQRSYSQLGTERCARFWSSGT